jgi:type II secretory pathway component GspD/PulD (secretin)
MDRILGTTQMKPRFTMFMLGLLLGQAFNLVGHLPAAAADLKLVDVPFSQVIELYAKETGRSVFLDEGVQAQRRVNAHLRGLDMTEALRIITNGMGLETTMIGTGTVLIFPSEKASRYRDESPPLIRRLPPGLEPSWVAGFLGALMPRLKIIPGPVEDRGVIEGEEAKVTIGDRIPLEVSATAQTDSGSTLKLQTQLQWVDVGIKMTVRQVVVNPDDSIRMGMTAEVSSVVATTKQGYPQIRTREATSSLRVRDGGSVVMGGLLSREERDGRRSIPWLSNIPLLGGLGRSRDRHRGMTEIVMIVTAHVVEE